MEIQITDKYVMTSDAHNFILNEVSVVKSGKTTGKVRLRPIGYYSCVSDLVEGVISKRMKSSTTRTMKAFLSEHTQLVDEIRRLFKVGMTGVGTMPCQECGNKGRLKVVRA
jgi:hypothetical protein